MKTKTSLITSSMHRSAMQRGFFLIQLIVGVSFFGLRQLTYAQCPQTCDDVGNTALGDDALFYNAGSNNTANGFLALTLNFLGSYNTAAGEGSLAENSLGSYNTAVGAGALYANDASDNTAAGFQALTANTTGSDNTAVGFDALYSNITGSLNTANGSYALYSNTSGYFNTANGYAALYSNTTGNDNTAYGIGSLYYDTSGSLNAALGYVAGLNLTSGSGNVCIGAGVTGVAGESNTTWVRNVYTSVATNRAVYVNSDNKIGTLSSSRRYKEEIKPMQKASETIFALKPVTFRYKKEVDASRALSFGLIAEEVAKVNPELITLDEEGRPQTVRYEAVNAMLLNEFLKEHRTVQEQGATITELKKEIAALTAGLQKVSAQLEVSKSAPQTVVNNR